MRLGVKPSICSCGSAAALLSPQGDLKVRAQPVSLRRRGMQARRRHSEVQIMSSAEG